VPPLIPKMLEEQVNLDDEWFCQSCVLIHKKQEAAAAEVIRLVNIRFKSKALEVMRLKAAAAAEGVRQKQETAAKAVPKLTQDDAMKEDEDDDSGLNRSGASSGNFNTEGGNLEDSGANDFAADDFRGNDDDYNSNESCGKKCLYIWIRVYL
jgi:Zn-finger protein